MTGRACLSRYVADWPQQGFLRLETCRDLEGEPVARRLGMCRADGKEAAAVEALAASRPVEVPELDRHRCAGHLSRRLRDDVHHSGQRIGAPHRRRRTADHFDLLDLRGIHRDEVPHHEPEEVLIDRAAVEQDQCGVLECSCRRPRGDVDVTGGRLGDVDARHQPHQVRHVLSRRVRDGVFADDRHRGRRVDQRLLASRGGNDNYVTRRRLRRVWFRFG